MNDNKQRNDMNKQQNDQQQQRNNQQRPKDLESQGEQKGAQQIPSSQTDQTRK